MRFEDDKLPQLRAMYAPIVADPGDAARLDLPIHNLNGEIVMRAAAGRALKFGLGFDGSQGWAVTVKFMDSDGMNLIGAADAIALARSLYEDDEPSIKEIGKGLHLYGRKCGEFNLEWEALGRPAQHAPGQPPAPPEAALPAAALSEAAPADPVEPDATGL